MSQCQEYGRYPISPPPRCISSARIAAMNSTETKHGSSETDTPSPAQYAAGSLPRATKKSCGSPRVGDHDGLAAWRSSVATTPRTGRGRPGKRLRRDAAHQPVSAKTLALELAANAWQQIKWRDGSNTPLRSRFARWRVRPARDDAKRCEPAPEEWLLIEWPEGETEPDHYWLATLPADISLERMVDQAKLRWRIERDYLELKQEVGLGHYEGRGWRGFHHHACLCVAAYGFLISEKETIPPSGPARTWQGAQSTAGPGGLRRAPAVRRAGGRPRTRQCPSPRESNREGSAQALSDGR